VSFCVVCVSDGALAINHSFMRNSFDCSSPPTSTTSIGGFSPWHLGFGFTSCVVCVSDGALALNAPLMPLSTTPNVGFSL